MVRLGSRLGVLFEIAAREARKKEARYDEEVERSRGGVAQCIYTHDM